MLSESSLYYSRRDTVNNSSSLRFASDIAGSSELFEVSSRYTYSKSVAHSNTVTQDNNTWFGIHMCWRFHSSSELFQLTSNAILVV